MQEEVTKSQVCLLASFYTVTPIEYIYIYIYILEWSGFSITGGSCHPRTVGTHESCRGHVYCRRRLFFTLAAHGANSVNRKGQNSSTPGWWSSTAKHSAV
jgi:hypothetical protein